MVYVNVQLWLWRDQAKVVVSVSVCSIKVFVSASFITCINAE